MLKTFINGSLNAAMTHEIPSESSANSSIKRNNWLLLHIIDCWPYHPVITTCCFLTKHSIEFKQQFRWQRSSETCWVQFNRWSTSGEHFVHTSSVSKSLIIQSYFRIFRKAHSVPPHRYQQEAAAPWQALLDPCLRLHHLVRMLTAIVMTAIPTTTKNHIT